jgi:hypothetical protein
MGTRVEAEDEVAARSRVLSEHRQLVSLVRYETVLGSPLPEPAHKLKSVYTIAEDILSKTLRCLNRGSVTRTSDLVKISDWLGQRYTALKAAADTGTALPFDILLLGLVSCTTTRVLFLDCSFDVCLVQIPLNLPLLLEDFVCVILRI